MGARCRTAQKKNWVGQPKGMTATTNFKPNIFFISVKRLPLSSSLARGLKGEVNLMQQLQEHKKGKTLLQQENLDTNIVEQPPFYISSLLVLKIITLSTRTPEIYCNAYQKATRIRNAQRMQNNELELRTKTVQKEPLRINGCPMNRNSIERTLKMKWISDKSEVQNYTYTFSWWRSCSTLEPNLSRHVHLS